MDNCSGKASVPTSFEVEIQQEADARITEVILRLIDKLEQIQNSSPEELLEIYVAFKKAKHRFKRKFFHDLSYSQIKWEHFYERLDNFTLKISEARRNYYDAKQYRDGTTE